jgi:Zn-dependent M28 family amino/carboxypeptidase
MIDLSPEVLGAIEADDHAWNILEELVSVSNRMAGQTGELAGAKIMKQSFADIGLEEIKITEFDVPGWWRGTSSVEVHAPIDETFTDDHDVIALPGTSSGTVESGFVDVGYGRPEDFESVSLDGQIALVSSETPKEYDRWIHRMEKYSLAIEHGAEGFLFMNHVPGALPPTGEIGYRNRPGEIPAVGVSKEFGSKLIRRNDEGLEVTLSVDCTNKQTTSCNVSGSLGPDTKQEILVTAHHDAHDIAEGAMDNGVGCALVSELARSLKQIEEQLDIGVRFVTFGSEELALDGSSHYVETHEPDEIKCVFNIDGAGDSRTPKLRSHGIREIEDIFREVTEAAGSSTHIDDELYPYTDAWPFVEAGIPAVTMGSKTKDGGRGWGHTHADTLDKIDRRDLRALAVIYLRVILRSLDGAADIEHRSSKRIRRDLDRYYARSLEISGRWETPD